MKSTPLESLKTRINKVVGNTSDLITDPALSKGIDKWKKEKKKWMETTGE